MRSLSIITLFYCLRSTRPALANGKEESFCDKRLREYDEDRREYSLQCVYGIGDQSPSCCNIIKESLEDRVRQYHILCPGRLILGPKSKEGISDCKEEPNHRYTRDHRSTITGECKIDLLIIWDNSRSIGKSTFDNQVKDFFRNLINSQDLNVGPDGTHIAIITFSTEERTKVLLEFGEKTTKEDLLQFINGLTWSEVEGDATRTGRAFMLANQLFPQDNPLNGCVGRDDVKDVVMLLTDGQPIRARGAPTYGFYDRPSRPEEFATRRRSGGETRMADFFAEKLRTKVIRVIAAFIGSHGGITLLQRWTTTPSDAIGTSKSRFTIIVSTMVDKSCKKTDCRKEPKHPECIRPGKCDCAPTEKNVYLKPGKDMVEVHWLKPTLKCSANPPVVEKLEVNPAGTVSPKKFGVGNHVISYTYQYQNGRDHSETHTCSVQVNVKLRYICGGKDYDPLHKVCCQGKLQYIIESTGSWKCCGKNYYNDSYIASKDITCP